MDIPLSEEVKEYTADELKQLKKMTEEVRDYWKEMVKSVKADDLKKAIDMSIAQTEADLAVIEEQLRKS